MGEPAFQHDLERRYTYADYLTWPDDFRCELIEGKVYMMSPAPTLRHQDVVGEVFVQIKQHSKASPVIRASRRWMYACPSLRAKKMMKKPWCSPMC